MNNSCMPLQFHVLFFRSAAQLNIYSASFSCVFFDGSRHMYVEAVAVAVAKQTKKRED